MQKKTVVIWDQLGQEPIKFFVTDDKRFKNLNNIYINDSNADPKKEKLLGSLMYDDNGKCKVRFLGEFPNDEVAAGADVIVCGFLP